MISAILLAAGQSRRMNGENKLLKKYKKKYLINHILSSLIKSKINKVFVVVGYQQEKIRDILLNKKLEICDESELMLFLAARAQNTSHGIKKELNNNKFVICDRYTDSSLVYQGFGKNLDKNFINFMSIFGK